MNRFLALLWLAVVLGAGGYLALRLHQGVVFRTDLTALLPREEQDPALRRANDSVTRALSQRVVLMVGHPDRDQARRAARALAETLSGQVDLATQGLDKDGLKRLGGLYFPYRRGLLSQPDRDLLIADKPGDLANRALAQAFGFVGMSDPRLLRQDPFLLLQDFFTGLPIPLSRLHLDDGMLSLQEAGTTWILMAGRLVGEPYGLATQTRLVERLDPAVLAEETAHPGLEVLRLGAVFYARAGAEQAMTETSRIGVASTLGTILLVLLVFRAFSPLWSNLLVIGVGVLTALSTGLWIFGELHVGALLFGVSLIGVAVDYGLQYCAEIFAPDPADPKRRLSRVIMAVTLGMATTVVGYLTLFLAPFPGLHQIAAFSAVGLLAAWVTVVLWLPALDRARPPRHGGTLLFLAGRYLSFWEDAAHRRWRILLFAAVCLAGLLGMTRLHSDDDVRRMQSLAPALLAQQERIQALIGNAGGNQFFLVQAGDDEAALRLEEALADRLRPLVGQGVLAGFQSPAQYVPSAERQRSNRALQRQRLDPLMAAQMKALGLEQAPDRPDDEGPVLSLAQAAEDGPVRALLTSLLLTRAGDILHVVLLDAPVRLDILRRVAEDMPGVRLIDPAGDFSVLLGKYRLRAIWLLALSAVLMAPLLVWRYGIRGGVRVMLPPSLAVVLTPALRALAGGGFTFFDAMALVLVLSIGVDYAVFCAETSLSRKPVTMLAVAMAACTALMSFGLLALSDVLAVHAFGSTMLVGILLAFLLAPLGRSGSKGGSEMTQLFPVKGMTTWWKPK